MSTTRLEAFSDGVMAVAITLLVLNLTVPLPPDTRLAHDLLDHWGKYPAYAISFLTIGIIWINHHAMIGRLREADHAILMLNVVLLMTIVVLPFTTSLIALYVNQRHGANLAAILYAASLLGMGVSFAALNLHILFSKPQLLSPSLSREQRGAIIVRSVSGVIPYALALAVAPFSPYATLIICGVVAAFYATPIASGIGV